MYSEVSDFSAWKVRSKDSNLFYERDTTMLSGNTWVLCTDIQMNLLDVISRSTKTLVEIVGKKCIFNGIQTSANHVYIFIPTEEDRDTYTFLAFNGKTYQVEKEVTKPYFVREKGKMR